MMSCESSLWAERRMPSRIYSDASRKNPFFQVSVPDVRVKWHKPEVDWCAVYKERQFPGEAVFSQGELNSCAIAFFLALATSHTNGLQFLMLDDPVQNMDEIHIEEFANVLKFLKDILGMANRGRSA